MSKKEIFISYGREPEVKQFVRKLRDDLQKYQFTVWLDETDIPAGADFREAIATGLSNCRALIAIITTKYIHSHYCKSELYMATSDNKKIYPIIYEEVDFVTNETGRGVKLEISGINWTMMRPRVDDYKESLDKLMQGLTCTAIKGSSHKNFQLSKHEKNKWKGYYQQGGVKYDMILPSLEFDSMGKISGEGVDAVGNFNISGLKHESGEVQFIKQYVGKHAVYYNGFQANNVIHGNWSIPTCGYSGSFELTHEL